MQRDYFSCHKNILHLGVGLKSNLGYIDSDIEVAIEHYLKYCKRYPYLRVIHKVKTSFDKWFERAERDPTKRAVGISSELFSFTFPPDSIDVAEKAERLFDIFSQGTKIIFLIRSQKELVRSFYKEVVRLGYFKTYSDFIDYIYKFRDRNFFHDLTYSKIYKLYASLFGDENVFVLPVENYLEPGSSGSRQLMRDIDSILGLSRCSLSLGNKNSSLSEPSVCGKMLLNRDSPHDLGRDMFSGVENHRLKAYFNDVLRLDLDEREIYRDVAIKRRLIEESASKVDSDSRVDYSCDNTIAGRLYDEFIESNIELSGLAGNVKIPPSYFELRTE